jgi:hypothetical protein
MIYFIEKYPWPSLFVFVGINSAINILIIELALKRRIAEIKILFSTALNVGQSFDGTVKDIEKNYKTISEDMTRLLTISENHKNKLEDFERRISSLENRIRGLLP